MLDKSNRLTKKSDFDSVFKGGGSAKSGFLVLRAKENHLEQSRIGFVVSNKVSGKATLRNKIKRRLRNSVRGILGKIKKPCDIVIISLPGAQKLQYPQIKESVGEIFKKSGLI